MKKILSVVGVSLVAFILALGILYIFSAPDTEPGGGGFISNIRRQFTPLGGDVPAPSDDTEEVPSPETSSTTIFTSSRTFAALWPEPVAGAIAHGKRVRIVERATGHVYDIDTTTGVSTVVSNTTVPKVLEVSWVHPDRFYLRYLREDDGTVETFAASVNDAATLDGTFLPNNITTLAPRGERLAYILNGDLVISGLSGENPRAVFSSPFSSWDIAWLDDATIGLYPTPSIGAPGALIAVTVSSGVHTPLFTNKHAFSALPNSAFIVYQSAAESVMYRRSDKTETTLTAAVVPEKCAWAPTDVETIYCAVPRTVPSGFPDTWYQGRVALVDELWRMNAVGLTPHVLLTPNDVSVDAVDLSINETETLLSFIDKTTGIPYAVDLSAIALDESPTPDQS